MSEKRTYRILIGGGGTGGHVFPAIAIADALKALRPGWDFLFVGARGKMEMERVPEAGYRIEGLPVAGFQRRLTLKNLSFFTKLLRSMFLARKIIRDYRPDVAIGVGGYASGPILKAASRRKVPCVIQEQNSYAGLTNRLLAKTSAFACVAYEGMEKYFPGTRIHLTGNPVRKSLVNLGADRAAAIEELGLEKGRRTCLVIGGSLGARTLNRSLIRDLAKLDREDVQVLWQCGRFYHEEVLAAVEPAGMKHIHVLPFISRMDLAYTAADVIISRAGAISISELCLVGKAAILVPSPNVAEDHQRHNAEALVAKQAALMVPDAAAGDELVDRLLTLLGDMTMQEKLAANIRKLGIGDAAGRIADLVIELIEKDD